MSSRTDTSSAPSGRPARRRVVITGVGVVCPLGNDVETYWHNLLVGKSGVGFIADFSTEKLRSDIAAGVRDFDVTRWLSAKESDIYGRVTHFSLGAAVEAMAMAGFDGLRPDDEDQAEVSLRELETGGQVDPTRFGCLMSTGMGSVDIFEHQIARSTQRGPRAVSPYFIPGVMPNGTAALIAMRYGLMGPSYSLASACATGTHSIATSALMIESGDADVMLAGGGEAATRLNTVAGFGNARALAKAFEGDPARSSRPYDKRRTGFVMGEGAGALVLEEEQHALARGKKPLAYLSGFGMTTDAQHLTRPHKHGLGLQLALQRAIARAGIRPEDIDYINPHATSTIQGDLAEVLALRKVFGDNLSRIPISATKSMIGHVLGGAGAVESVAVVCSIRDQRVHPTINLDEQDPNLGQLTLPREQIGVDIRYAAKCSAGFGGHNCALVFGRPDASM